MEKYIHEENLKRYRQLLAMETDLEKRQQIEYLITEELGKAPRPEFGKTMNSERRYLSMFPSELKVSYQRRAPKTLATNRK